MCSRISRLNNVLSQHKWAKHTGIAIFILSFFTYLSHFTLKYGLNVPPSTTGDETSYDSIGWELSHGNGFSRNFNNPVFRIPYEQTAANNPMLQPLPHQKSGPTTVRPPLFPLLIAATDYILGRQFWAVRVINTLAIAATCGLVVHALLHLAGVLPAFTGAFLFVVIDFHTRLYARAVLSEAITCFLVALFVLALFKVAETQQKRWIIAAAISYALAILARNIMVLWSPGLMLLVYLLLRKNRRNAIFSGFLFIGTVLLTMAPWMIRNCVVLHSFMPMGTQGLTQLPAGYSDIAWEHQGVWQNLDSRDFFKGVVTEQMTTLESELARAKFSRKKTVDWISHNKIRAIGLAPLKVFHEFRPYTWSETVIFLLTITGLLSLKNRQEGKILLGILFINLFAVAITWSVSGRFLTPLLFVFHVAAAMGAWKIVIWITEKKARKPG